jgi:hypothetical protein
MFKRGAGLAITIAMAVAAMRYAGPSSGAPGAGPTSAPAPVASPVAYAGGCTAYDRAAAATAGKPYDNNSGDGKRALDEFFGIDTVENQAPSGIRYAIAITPDPLHTQLSLMFDREISVVQQAAQDAGYIYNSSWFPWNTDKEGSLTYLADRQYAADLTDGREACPGVILFRRNLQLDQNASAGEAYREGLVVFVVGEQPTGGINHDQWTNALSWLRNHAQSASGGMVKDGVLRILGPSFTGSLDSLERDLSEAYQSASSHPAARSIAAMFPEARVLSGSVSGCSQIQRFEHRIQQLPELNGQVRFGSFQENDALHIYRFLEYLKSIRTDPGETAILSEDETAYASTYQYQPSDGPTQGCDFPYAEEHRPLNLVYPRDISALRDAYQRQSVFDTSEDSKHASHAILKDEAEDKPGGDATDTVPAYSKNQSAVAQEAYMFGVVSFLRTHHTRYLILRCTNPLDFLFLARFFHREYPEARIVTVGSDLLFRREIDTTEFRGILALSSYPLIPRGQHWTKITEDAWEMKPHDHLIFADHLTEGIYIAARYLLTPEDLPLAARCDANDPKSPEYCGGPRDFLPPIHLHREFQTPDYSDPFWLHRVKCPNLATHPPTWLAAVGRDGYWPLAVLRDSTPKDGNTEGNSGACQDRQLTFPQAELASPPKPKLQPKSTMVELDGQWLGDHSLDDQHYQLKMERDDQTTYAKPPKYDMWLALRFPTVWTLCLALSLLLAGYQFWGVTRCSARAYRLFSIFRKTGKSSQDALLGASCALGLMPLIELTAFGFFNRVIGTLGDSRIEANCPGVLLIVAFLMFACLWTVYGNRTSLSFLGSLTGLTLIYWIAFGSGMDDANRIPLVYRMVHLTDGVSPLLPMLLLTVGFYLWNWQAIAGNLMLSPGCPELPQPLGATGQAGQQLEKEQARISQKAADKISNVALPLSFPVKVWAFPAFLLVTAVVCFAFPLKLPLLSPESFWFNIVLNLLLLSGFLFTVGESLRLYYTWLGLQRVLHALARLQLRRTLCQLRPIDANSLWSVSGSVPRIQYRLFVRQLGAAHRIDQLTPFLSRHCHPLKFLPTALQYGDQFKENAESGLETGIAWEKGFAPASAPNAPPKTMRTVLADAVAEVINEILVPEWKEETVSLNFEQPPEDGDEGKGGKIMLPLSEKPRIRAAEEFVCFHYIAFIQNIIARLRTMTLSMVFLFVSVCFAISFYPFVPRTEITVWMILNLVLIGFAVAYVYAGMDRDEVMSYIANTKPGQLGLEFWLKLATFLIGPVIGILTTQFPSIADSVLGWLQPGMDAIK